MRSATLGCVVALLALPAARITAQALAATPVVATDSGGRMVRVAEGVYTILHEDATTDWPDRTTNWPHGNTGVIVGRDAVLIVDATYLPARAEADIRLVRRVTDRPVKWLVNTHWHGDHTHGNGAWLAAVPGMVIVGPRAARDVFEVNLSRVPRLFTADGSATRRRLAELEALLAAGRDSTHVFDARERASLAQVVAEYRVEQRELQRVVVAPPTMLFDGRLTLDLGGRTVELVDRGPGNSPHDVTIHVPDAQVLFAGDLLVHPVPYTFGVSPLTWIAVLRELEAIPVSAVVPGHGPVFADHSYTVQVRELLEGVRDRVRARLMAGENLQSIQARPVDLSDLRARFVKPGDTNAAAYWSAAIMGPLIESMVPCLTGSRC